MADLAPEPVQPAITPSLPAASRAVREGFVLLIALVALVPAAKAVLYDTLDPDSFIHMLAADQMWREGIGPIVDHQSFMSLKEPWTPYSWLAEMGMKVVWDHAGFRGAIASHALMAAALMCFVAMGCSARVRTQADPDRLARIGLATAFAAFLSIPYLSFRPVTLALVIMAMIAWLLVRDRTLGERSRAAWLVIPLTVLLVNVHLYAIIVPAWLAALFAGALWERLRPTPNDDRAEAKRRAARYGVMFAGTGLACLATPMLRGAIKSIAFYQSADPMVAGTMIKEYLPFYAGTPGTISAVLVILMIVFAIYRRHELRAGEVCWLLGSIVLLLRMGRFSPVFAMAAAPMLAATLPHLADGVLGRTATRLALMVSIGAGLFRAWQEFPGRAVTFDQWMEREDPTMPGYPARAALFVEQAVPRRTGRMINEYSWGGYLSWRLGGKFQVLLDGRTNLFPPEFWRKTYLTKDPNEIVAFLNSIDADVAVLPTGSGRFLPILEGAGWHTALMTSRATVSCLRA